MARAGFVTGASERNWASYGPEVTLFEGCADWQRAILTDPQTSGGLLVACAPEMADRVLAVFERHGFEQTAVVGALTTGRAGIGVKP